MRRVAAIVSGRRAKWLIVVLWLILVFVAAPLSGKLADETEDETADFLPRDAESKQVLETLEEQFPGGDTENTIVVYRREGGLTPDDQQRIREDAEALLGLETALEAFPPFGEEGAQAQGGGPQQGQPAAASQQDGGGSQPPEAVSPDGEVAFTTLITEGGDQDKIADEAELAEEELGTPPEGLEVYLSGSLGFTKDSAEVFEGLDEKLLLATVSLVLVLLLLIYRAPLIAITPVLVVGFSYMVATGIVYLLAKGGMHVDSQGTSILGVLMFGAGTDYCLLLVSRYREELRRIEDKHEAMARAVRRAGPAILASGLTVVGALLTMLFADLGSTRSLGPIAAIGVATVMVASLTLLPALLVIFGRRGFWPRRRLIAYDPEHKIEERSLWRRFGLRVVQRPVLALLGSSAILGVLCLGLLSYEEDFNINSFFRDKPESVQGFEVLQSEFPAGFLDATTLLLERSDGAVTEQDIRAAQQRVSQIEGVAEVRPVDVSEDGQISRLAIVFEEDPYAIP